MNDNETTAASQVGGALFNIYDLLDDEGKAMMVDVFKEEDDTP